MLIRTVIGIIVYDLLMLVLSALATVVANFVTGVV